MSVACLSYATVSITFNFSFYFLPAHYWTDLQSCHRCRRRFSPTRLSMSFSGPPQNRQGGFQNRGGGGGGGGYQQNQQRQNQFRGVPRPGTRNNHIPPQSASPSTAPAKPPRGADADPLAWTPASLGSQIFRFEVENGLDEVRRLDDSATGTCTDLCPMFFSAAGCTRGDRCQWRHARNDRLTVCKHYLRGLCKKQDLCDYLHSVDSSRMPECFFFSKYGECSNQECPYRHVDQEKKKNECPYYARGFCRHGPKCRNRHVKRVACPNYLAGFCIDGPDCVFGHARFEIPRMPDDDDVYGGGMDRFGFGRSRGPLPRMIKQENGQFAMAAGV